jgi:outer membrane protease
MNSRPCIALAVVLALAGSAGAADLTLSGGVSARRGDHTYRIGGTVVENGVSYSVNDPLSELEFPLDTYFGEAAATLRLTPRWEMFARAGFPLSDDAGTLKDSDWEITGQPGLLTTYSESDTDFSGWDADIGLRWWMHGTGDTNRWDVGFGAGWRLEDYRWKSLNTAQVSLAGFAGGQPVVEGGFYPGTAIDYQSALDMPYAEVSALFRDGRWSLDGRLAAAPWLMVDSEDDHVLRGIYSDAELDGWGWLGEVGVRYDISPTWFLRGSAGVLSYEADGEAKTRVYGGDDPDLPPGARWTIDQEAESFTTTLRLEAGWHL